jgi:hypothetical protein
MADAFQSTYWWAVGLLALAFIPALFVPRRAPDATSSDETPAEVPIPMH